MSNVLWTRGELILALDLYFNLNYGQMDGRNLDVIALSNLLTLMNADALRSFSAVSLKLANFKRLDPEFKGKGMVGGNKLEEEIWNRYFSDKKLLSHDADIIRRKVLDWRKGLYIKWLNEIGKPNRLPYKLRTIQTYAAQIEYGITTEFTLKIGSGNLFGLTDLNLLTTVAAMLHKGEDGKRRKDLRSAFQSYLRFVMANRVDDENSIKELDCESQTEGGQKVYISVKAERNKALRNKAIILHGTCCKACGFDFGVTYGVWGEGFIEVHHLVPLASAKLDIRITDPYTDLIVLCSNCHRMVHRFKSITLTVSELKRKIELACAL